MDSDRWRRIHDWSAHNRAHSRIASSATLALVAFALALVGAQSAAAAGTDPPPQTQADVPITFSVTGDAPYGDDENPEVQEVFDDHNLYSTAEFFVHVGDIFEGGTPCDEYRFEWMGDELRELAVPAFIVPGDNETKDCSDPALAWTYWEEHLLGIDQNTCTAPSVSRQSGREQNFAFVKSNVLFIGIHLVGGSNDDAILQDDADWVDQKLDEHLTAVRAAVIFSQAGPGDADLFFDQFEVDAQAFGKPILFVHGDGHEWDRDFPFESALNVQRIQVERGNQPPVHVTVTTNPDTINTFLFERDPWPSGTALYNVAPCSNAGPDKAISITQQVYLVGSGKDDGVPTNPGELSYSWAKTSGPGTVNFSDPNEPVTFASFSVTGTYWLSLRANDGALTDDDTVRIMVTDGPPINDPPTANGESYSVAINNSISISAPGVLANDSDPNGDAITAVLTDGVSNGSLSLKSNGSFTYTPNPNWFGTDSFQYRAHDGVSTSAKVTVTIDVEPVRLSFGALEDVYVVSDEPAENFGDSESLRLDEDDVTYHSYLKFSVNGTGATIASARLRLYVTNDSDSGGSVYRVSNSQTGTSTPWTEHTLNWQNALAMNGAPLATLGEINEDEYVEWDVTSAIVGDGVYSFGLRNSSDDSARFSSKEGDDPPELVVLTIPGGGNSNAAPVARNDNHSVAEDASLSRTPPGVLGNDSDADGDPLTVVLQRDAAHGAVNLQPNGSFTYTPNPNYNGADSFTYVTDDNRGGQDAATVSLTVTPVNDPPVGSPESYTTDEDVALSIAAPGVLANDSDLDGDALTTIVVGNPGKGSLNLATNGSFTYTPNADANGSDAFTYRVRDGQGGTDDVTVSIDITSIEDAPVALGEAYDTQEDVPLVVAAPGVLANDRDAENDPMTVSVTSTTQNGSLDVAADGSFTYTPFEHYHGPDAFTYVVTDSNGGSDDATVTLNVISVNDVPMGMDDSYSTAEDMPLTIVAPGVLANDTDADGDSLRVTVVVPPPRGLLILHPDGSFEYTPEPNDNGTLVFSYRVDDGAGGSDTRNVTLEVAAVEDVPVAGADAFASNEDELLSVAAPGVLANDSDAESDPLSVSVHNPPQNGTLVLNADGSFSYTPHPNFYGADGFSYIVSDPDGDSDLGSVSLDIAAVNDAPVGVDDAFATDEDVVLAVSAPGVLQNDSDVDLDALSVSLGTAPAYGVLVLSADGSFNYTPNANAFGTDAFTYVVADGAGGTDTRNVVLDVSAVNDVPVGTDDSYGTDEDVALSVAPPGVLGNDMDVDADPLAAMVVLPPLRGTLALNLDGGFTYTPYADASGADGFTYAVTDGAGGSDTRNVTLDVAAINDAPVGNDDIYETPEDTTLDVEPPGVLWNDGDVDGDPLSVSLVTPPSLGTLVLESDGGFRYEPYPNESGTDRFTYVVDDGAGGTDTRTVTLHVGAVNDAPVGADDSYAGDEDALLVVAAPGVLANDTDNDADALSVVVATPPTSGTLVLDPDGGFTYTPAPDANGMDEFTYTISDGVGGFDTSRVALAIAAVNDAPVGKVDSYTTHEDSGLEVGAPGVLSNDTDVDGDALTVTVANVPMQGVLVLNPDGSFHYMPGSDYNGTDTFSYEVVDGAGGSDTRVVTLDIMAVNDTPQPSNDLYATDEDTPLSVAAPGLIGNDSDVDGDALTATVAEAPSFGSITLDADGSFVYTPDPDANGTDTFTYNVIDGYGGVAQGSVTLQVAPVQDAPRPLMDAYATNEDEALVIPAPGVLSNDIEVDGETLNAALVAAPANGTVALDTNGAFTYTPSADFQGSDSFTYAANDDSGGTETTTVSIAVDAVNDAPTANADSYTTAEDNPLTISAPGILGNDSDVDGDVLAAAIATQPDFGSLTLNADGSFIYTPQADYNGVDSFTYTLSDGHGASDVGAVTLAIAPRNDAPVVTSESYAGDEDEVLDVPSPGVLANDTDVDGDAMTVTLNAAPTRGTLELRADGSFSYAPLRDFNGSDSFTYRVTDGQGGSQLGSATLNVSPVNDAPVSQGDSFSTSEDVALTVTAPSVLANDTDVDADSLAAEMVSSASNGTVEMSSDGSFTYTPDADFHGSDSFTYRALDGDASSNISTVSIEVTAVNDLPVTAADFYALDEDGSLSVPAPGVLGNDTDVEGSLLGANVVSAPANGALWLGTDGAFTYTPQSDFSGQDTFTYAADDGAGGTATETVTLTINPMNDEPVAARDDYETNEDEILSVAAPGVLSNDTDVENDDLSVTVSSPPANGALDLRADGSLTYVPAAEFFGSDSFTYTVRDGNGGFDTGAVSLVIVPVNDAPAALDAAYTSDEDVVLRVEAPGLLTGASDADGDALQVALQSQAAHGMVNVEANGAFTYVPEAHFNGTDEFVYAVEDGNGATSTATVALTIQAVPDAPQAEPDAHATLEDVVLAVAAPGVLQNDTDVDGDVLQVTTETGPAHGSLELHPDGGFRYTPNPDYNGSDSFVYTVADASGSTDVGTVTLAVAPDNDAPLVLGEHYEVAEDEVLVIGAPGVLANDSDVDGDVLSATVGMAPAHGVVLVGADGSFEYTPDPDYSGDDSFEYFVDDSNGAIRSGTVEINVRPVNDAPVAASDEYTLDEDGLLEQPQPGVLLNDTDVDTDVLVVTLAEPPAFGTVTLNADGGFVYTPREDFHGTDSFSYVVDDGAGETDTGDVSITVLPVNDAPTAANDAYVATEDVALTIAAPGLLSNDGDIEDDVLSAELESAPSNGTVTVQPDGGFTFIPHRDFAGSDSFGYVVRDGSDSDHGTVSISVVAVNDAPVTEADRYTLSEDATLQVGAPGVLVNDTDVEGDALRVSVGDAPERGTLRLQADGGFNYVPYANFYGTDSFTYVADDGQGGKAVGVVSLDVEPVNDVPVAQADSFVVAGSRLLSIEAPGLLANDADVDADTLAVVLVKAPQYGDLTLRSDGSFQYEPFDGFTGSDAFTYRAFDGQANSADVPVHIAVEGRGVTYRGDVAGAAEGVATMTTDDTVRGGQGLVYVVAVSSRPYRSIERIEGLELDWSVVRRQCASGADAGVEVWSARGTGVDGAVTVYFESAPEHAVMHVTRFSGVDGVDPIGTVMAGNAQGLDGECGGFEQSDAYAFEMQTLTEGGIIYAAVTMGAREHESSNGFIERAQTAKGTGSNVASLASVDRVVDATTNELTGRFDADAPWAVVAVEIRSQLVPDDKRRFTNALESRPNPFNAELTLEYTLYRRTPVQIRIYDANGRVVRNLLQEVQPPGRVIRRWDAKDNLGRTVGSGVYFVRMDLEGHTLTRKVILLK